MKNYPNLKKIISTIWLSMIAILANSQNITQQEPSDFMRSNGKIYVVMTIILIILAGFFIYLFNVDRKISRIEKEHK